MENVERVVIPRKVRLTIEFDEAELSSIEHWVYAMYNPEVGNEKWQGDAWGQLLAELVIGKHITQRARATFGGTKTMVEI